MNRSPSDDWPYPRWIGHRGAGKEAPENTLAAFQRGWAAGFRMFECDVKLSADGVPFLLHDATLDRTTSARGPVGYWAWRDLEALDAGAWHSSAYQGERLPSLDALAQWCIARGAMLNIEIKPVPGREVETGASVALKTRSLWSGVGVKPLLTSFQPQALQAAQLAAPELPRGLLLAEAWSGWERVAADLGCVAVVGHHPIVTELLVQTARQRAWRVLAYTVNEPVDARRLMGLGVDGLITDHLQLPGLV